MLQVYERAYRLYVVTYKMCQMLQSLDKLVLRLKFIVTVELLYYQAKVILSNVKQECDLLPPGFAVN